MRIGIDAHIILPKHKRYDPKIARYTESLIKSVIESKEAKKHEWVLFFDDRMTDKKKLEKFQAENVVIRHFPFVQYRKYLPVLYSHMLISAFLRKARLDVFHSPEGLIPFVYPGKIVSTFHYVPRGKLESNLFVRTFMMGARAAFAQMCKRARRIIVHSINDKNLLLERHGCQDQQVVVMETDDTEKIDWPKRVRDLIELYETVSRERKTNKKKTTKKSANKKKKTKKPAKKKK